MKKRSNRQTVKSIIDLKQRLNAMKESNFKIESKCHEEYYSLWKELQAEKLSTKFQMNNSAFFYDLATQLRIFVANESLHPDSDEILKVITRILLQFENFKDNIRVDWIKKNDEIKEIARLNKLPFNMG